MTDLVQIIRPRVPRPATVLLWITFASLVVPTGLVAIALGLAWLELPYELLLVLRRLPLLFPAHMVASGAALILIPIAALVRRRRGAHRAVGRLAAAAVVVGGCAAVPVAFASEASAVARAGFAVQGVVWLALLVAAVTAIRRGSRSRHAALMLAMAAVASGAIWLRLTIAVANAAALPFDRVYAVAAWACWLVPLAAAVAMTGRDAIVGSWRGRRDQAVLRP
jgi:predicted membrane protein DUF2306